MCYCMRVLFSVILLVAYNVQKFHLSGLNATSCYCLIVSPWDLQTALGYATSTSSHFSQDFTRLMRFRYLHSASFSPTSFFTFVHLNVRRCWNGLQNVGYAPMLHSVGHRQKVREAILTNFTVERSSRDRIEHLVIAEACPRGIRSR